MNKYKCFGIFSLFALGLASYSISSGLVAKSSPVPPGPRIQDQDDSGGINEDGGPRIVQVGETITSSSAAHIQQLIAERECQSGSGLFEDTLESQRSVKLRTVLPARGGVHVLGDATIFDRQISGPYVWNISVTTVDGDGVTEFSYPDGAFMTEAGQQDRFVINEFVPVELQEGTYFVNLALDCLSEPSNVGRLGPVSSQFEAR